LDASIATETVAAPRGRASVLELIGAFQRRLSHLVMERQELRERCASPLELERNRRQIVSNQRALSVTLGAHFGAHVA
jgi:hypothetical protein